MVGWHHRLNQHGFGWTPGIGDGQGGLAPCSSWDHKDSDTPEWLNETWGNTLWFLSPGVAPSECLVSFKQPHPRLCRHSGSRKIWITLETGTWILTCYQNAVCTLRSGAISVVASHNQRSFFVTKTTSFPHTLNIIMNSSWGLLLSALCPFCDFPPLPSSSLRKGAITNSQNNWTANLKQHFTLGN